MTKIVVYLEFILIIVTILTNRHYIYKRLYGIQNWSLQVIIFLYLKKCTLIWDNAFKKVPNNNN